MTFTNDDESFETVQDYVPALINILSSRLTATSSATYRTSVGLSALELRILVALADGRTKPAHEIATAVGQDKGPVSRCLKQLAERGLIDVRAAERGHRRDISITAAGDALHKRAMPVAQERQNRLLADFTPTERERLIRDLKLMLERMDDVAAPYC